MSHAVDPAHMASAYCTAALAGMDKTRSTLGRSLDAADTELRKAAGDATKDAACDTRLTHTFALPPAGARPPPAWQNLVTYGLIRTCSIGVKAPHVEKMEFSCEPGTLTIILDVVTNVDGTCLMWASGDDFTATSIDLTESTCSLIINALSQKKEVHVLLHGCNSIRMWTKLESNIAPMRLCRRSCCWAAMSTQATAHCTTLPLL